jgi:uncharacterized membrane protein YfcA
MDATILLYVAVGFVAQMIDGALGMAYGVSSNSFLLSLGIPPAAASASVHAAEVFTTAVSGASHWRLGNVDWSLLRRLLIPGVLGAVAGAYLLTAAPADFIKPAVAVYLLAMGGVILFRAWRPQRQASPRAPAPALGLAGGFLDAIGGGGWGPIVTTTLVARGHSPRSAVGSVNLAEFFVTLSQSVVFLLTIGLQHWQVILGLLIGGVLAAPLAAVGARHIPARLLIVLVGVAIILLSLRTLLQALGWL